MKQHLLFPAFAMVTLSLPGCGPSDGPAQPPGAATTTAPQNGPAVEPPRPQQVKPRPFPGKRPELAQFKRHRVGSVAGSTPRPAAADRGTSPLRLVAGDADLDAEAESVMKGLGPTSAKSDCLDALARLAGAGSAKLPSLLSPLLSHSDSEVREMALNVLEGFDDPSVLPLAAQGMRDRDVNVRQQALELAGGVHAAETVPLISQALRDVDGNVRQTALQLAQEQSPAASGQMIRQAAGSSAPDLALAALSLLESAPDKQNVPVFIQALNHADADVRETAAEVLELTFHQGFQNAGQAAAWWSTNQGRYSAELVENVPSPSKPAP